MEYFGFLRIPQYILQFTRGASGGVSVKEMYIMLGAAGAAYLICLIFGGLALYNLAERAGIRHPWLGFIPFANTYYAGKIAGETSFFGRTMKRAGLYAMLAEIVYVAVETLSLVTSILIAAPEYYETTYLAGGGSYLTLNMESVPSGIRWMSGASNWLAVLSIVFDLVMIVFLCAVYNGLYRKYSPKNAYLMTVFSIILPVRGFLLFLIRNKEPVDYEEYMRARIEQVMRSRGIEPQQTDGGQQSDPFSDFSDGGGSAPSPFSEFDAPSSPPGPFDPFGDFGSDSGYGGKSGKSGKSGDPNGGSDGSDGDGEE